MKRGHQEIARTADAVAGEDAPGAVGAVRGRRQADEQQARARIAEAGHRPAPSSVSSRKARRFSRPMRWQYSRSRGQRSHEMMACVHHEQALRRCCTPSRPAAFGVDRA